MTGRAAVGKVLVALGILWGCAGCLQIETTIALKADGSGTITERVNFSRKLLDAAAAAGPELQLEPLLAKEAVLARMKGMGKGITLTRHEVRDGPKGSRECVSVYRIPDLADFVYVCPYLPKGYPHRLKGIRTRIKPLYHDHHSWRHLAGRVHVGFERFPPTKRAKQGEKTDERPGRSPLAAQVFRELRPVVADLMEGMQIKLAFEGYAPVEVKARDRAAGTPRVDLVSFSPHRDMDVYGYPFAENEEAMIDLARRDWNSAWIENNVKNWASNKTLPVLHHGYGIIFRPSRHYFKKYFEGKTLKTHRRGVIPARFEEIGWEPKKKTK
jgi:hypothetical protein